MVLKKYTDSPFSYSQLSTFKACSQKFKLTYLDGIRKPHESIEAFVGKRVHSVLEWLYSIDSSNNSYMTFDRICEEYDNIWRRKWHSKIFIVAPFKNSDYYYSMGKRCLSNYYKNYGPKFNQPVIGTEVNLSFLIGNHSFRGVIDRLDRLGSGKFMIHDYKTTKNEKTKSQAINDIQLGLYHMAIEQNYKNVKEISLKWHFLRQGTEVIITHNQDGLKKIKKKINGIIEKIIDSLDDMDNFDPKETIKSGFTNYELCNWCYLWEECSAKKISNPARSAD